MVAKFITRSVQDVIDRLGVPAFRIGMDPPPGMATEVDLLRHLDGDDKRLYELVDGTLVEKPMGAPESVMGAFVLQAIYSFADQEDLGLVMGADGPIRMLFGNVRMPDVSFFGWASMPDDEFPSDKVSRIVPVLAVEILSESNTREEMEQKRHDLFPSGTQLMWIIDPETETAEIYTTAKRCKVIDAKGILDGGKVLPGFQLQLAEVFQSLKRKTRKKKGQR